MFPTLQGFSQQLISVNGIKINAVIGGEGPPILLLHGWPETWWEWHHVMPPLAEHFSVVAMDLRGAGFSDCPLDGYDKATMARDAHEVMRSFGHDRYAVCGHDIGGMVALPQAALFREAVSHLAVLDVPLPGWSGWEETIAKLWHFAFHANRDLPERMIQGREYDYVSAFMAERFYDHSSFDPADIEIFARAMALPGRTRGAWSGIERSQMITRLHWNTRSNPSTYPSLLSEEISALACGWCPCCGSLRTTYPAAQSSGAVIMSLMSDPMRLPLR